MPYTVEWFIPNQVIYTRYFGVIEEQELLESLSAMNAMVAGSPHPYVHTIADVGDVVKPVYPQKAMQIAREAGSHERTGWNLIIREQSVLVKLGIAFGAVLVKSKLRAFATQKEAEAFLRDVDGTLNWQGINEAITLSD